MTTNTDIMAACRENHFTALQTRQWFRSMVGSTITCPVCANVLDYRRAVNLRTEDNGQPHEYILCRDCCPKTMRSLAARDIGYSVDIDGKALEAICNRRKRIPDPPTADDGMVEPLPDGGIARLPIDGLRAMLTIANVAPADRVNLRVVRHFYSGKRKVHYLTATDGKVLGCESWLDDVGPSDVGPFFIPHTATVRKSAKVVLLRLENGNPTLDVDGKPVDCYGSQFEYPETFDILSRAMSGPKPLAHDTILGVQTIGTVAAVWREYPRGVDKPEPTVTQDKKDGPVAYTAVVDESGLRVRTVLAMPVVRAEGKRTVRTQATDALANRLGK